MDAIVSRKRPKPQENRPQVEFGRDIIIESPVSAGRPVGRDLWPKHGFWAAPTEWSAGDCVEERR